VNNVPRPWLSSHKHPNSPSLGGGNGDDCLYGQADDDANYGETLLGSYQSGTFASARASTARQSLDAQLGEETPCTGAPIPPTADRPARHQARRCRQLATASTDRPTG